MSFQIPTAKYTGRINEVSLGPDGPVIGGQNAYGFHAFEGAFPHRPLLGLEVWDYDPGEDWPPALREAYDGVMGDPGAWARRCVEYGADLVCLHLKSSDPAGGNTGAEEAVASVRKVVEAVEAPVLVYGLGLDYRDAETLPAVAEAFVGRRLILGPVIDRNYRKIAPLALACGHIVAALSATDFNLAEQLNILLFNLGLPKDRLLMDPTTAALGYGMEYCYSVMERIQIGALAVNDTDIQQPMINFVGEESWRAKEAGLPTADNPLLGEAVCRGILLETTAAVSYLAAGSGLLSLRHPTSLKLTRRFLDLMYDGGPASGEAILSVPVSEL